MEPSEPVATPLAAVDEPGELNARLSAYEAGELSDAEAAGLRALLASPGPRGQEARSVFARLQGLRAATADLAPPCAATERQHLVGERIATQIRTSETRRQRTRLAAGVALLAAAAVGIWFLRPPPSAPPALLAGTTLRTGAGDFQLLPIGDRAVAFVGEDTELVATPGARPALRVLRGSVRLMVRRRAGEPFVVSTVAADVEVLGTEFDVSVLDGETEVKVVRGVVEVRNPHGHQRLWARESAVARAETAPRQLLPARGVVSEGSPEVQRQPP